MPSNLTENELAALLENIISTPDGLEKIVKRLRQTYPGFPGATTIYRWINEDQSFANTYKFAQEARADVLADHLITLADDLSIPSDQKRQMLDARKWAACHLKPKAFGDRIELNTKIEHEYSVSALLKSLAPSPLIPRRIIEEQERLKLGNQSEDAVLLE